jgi:hypothetical protein
MRTLQDFTKDYWVARAISRVLFFAVFITMIIGALLNLVGEVPEPFRDLLYKFIVTLFFSVIAVPGLAIWSSPQFGQGWLSVFNKRLYASAPWENLHDLNKAPIYFVSIAGLLVVLILLVLYVYTNFVLRS